MVQLKSAARGVFVAVRTVVSGLTEGYAAKIATRGLLGRRERLLSWLNPGSPGPYAAITALSSAWHLHACQITRRL